MPGSRASFPALPVLLDLSALRETEDMTGNLTHSQVATLDLSPPHHLPLAAQLPLGLHVCYSHRAAVARWKWTGSWGAERVGEWILTEGIVRRGGWRPVLGRGNQNEADDMSMEFGFVLDPFYKRPPRDGVNKTVFVWPEEGEGIVIGLVRRGIGQSWPASGFNDSWEPGGFAARAFVHLYAVKAQLEGLEYVFCPAWSVAAAA